jgi:hypothetical protein
MNTKLILTLTLLVGIFSTNLLAADYNPPKKPSMTLSSADMMVIDNAIERNFNNLSSKDKKKLKSFLTDYSNSVKSEKGERNQINTSNTKSKKKKGKGGIKVYSGGKTMKGNSTK